MIIQLIWDEPTDPSVTQVYIYRSSERDGVYNEVTHIDAKDANGNWVTSYTDDNSSADYWYKIRFFNGSEYSDFSDPKNAIYNVRYTSPELVGELLGLDFKNDASSTTPSNTAVWRWVEWAEDYIDQLVGYSFKIKNAVEYHNFDRSTSEFYTKHPFVYKINHLYRNVGNWMSPEWSEMVIHTDFNLVDAKSGRVRLGTSVFGDLAVKIDYDYGFGEVPKDVQQLATMLVARNVVKYILNNKVQNVGQSITVGAIKISNKLSDSVVFLNDASRTIQELENKVGALKVWFR